MATVTTAADTIAAAIPYLAAVTAGVANLSHTPPDVADKIQVAMQGVQKGVIALAASETSAQSKPIVSRILADGQAVLNESAPFAAMLPPPYGMYFGWANAMFPFLVGIVNSMVAAKVSVPPAAVSLAAA